MQRPCHVDVPATFPDAVSAASRRCFCCCRSHRTFLQRSWAPAAAPEEPAKEEEAAAPPPVAAPEPEPAPPPPPPKLPKCGVALVKDVQLDQQTLDKESPYATYLKAHQEYLAKSA